MMMKSVLEKIFLKSHHAQSPFSENLFYFIERWIFAQNYNGKWNFKPKISPIFHFYWVIDGWISGLKCKILIMYTTVSSLNLKKTFLDLELHNLTKTSHHITASSGMCFSKNSSCPWPFNAKVLVSPKIFQVVFSQSSYGHPHVLLAASFFETGAMATPTKSQNPTILGLGVPASTQWSQPSRFCHWCSSFGNNDYLPFMSTTQN